MKLRWSPLIIDAAPRNVGAPRQRQCSPAGTEGRRTGFGTKTQIHKVRMLSGQHKFARAGTSERQRPGFEIKMEIHKAKTPSGKKKLIRAWLPYGPPPPPSPRHLRAAFLPGFHGPGGQNRYTPRELDNLGVRGAAFLRPGKAESACRTRTGRPGSRIRCVSAVRRGRCLAPVLAPWLAGGASGRRRRLLPPKPCSGVCFGGAGPRFSPPWLAGGASGRRRRLLPPKPCSGVYFGAAWRWFSPPWLAGGASGRRRRLLPPKPCSGVYFGGAWPRFSPPWLAGGPPGASGLSF